MRRFLPSMAFSVVAWTCAYAADAPPGPAGGAFGAWTFDPVLSGASADSAAPASADAPKTDARPQHHGGGRHGGGGMGGGGMNGGGMGGAEAGGHGGAGHHGDRPAAAAPSHFAMADAAEQHERGLARAFAPKVTITALARRIRFDDGEHVVELDKDGTNVSGPGVGGTVALTATGPEIVVETLTESGYSLQERYRMADDGQHLEMHVSLKHPDGGQAREFVRVFDRARTADVNAPAR